MVKKFLKIFIGICLCLFFLTVPGKYAQGTVAIGSEAFSGTTKNVDLKINSVSGDAFRGGTIFVTGESSPYSIVSLRVKNEKDDFIYSALVGADYTGSWSAKLDQPVKSGRYYIEAVAKDKNGVLSLPTRSDLIYIMGPFAFVSTILLFLVIILSAAFIGGWYASKSRETKRYRRIIASQNDINVSYNILRGDVNKAEEYLKDFRAGNYKEEGKINEAMFFLERVAENLEKTGKYILQGVEAISKYDFFGKNSTGKK